MSKITDFYAKVLADESAKTKLGEILGGKAINEADNSQLEKIGSLAKELGFDITIEEAQNYLKGDNAELDDDDLGAVAGGTGGSKAPDSLRWVCDMPGNLISDLSNIDDKLINPKFN